VEGIINKDGTILGDDGKIYQADMKHNNTILLVCSSWSRFSIEEVKGKRVTFQISPNGKGYNYKLIK
jgi:hypothetical protein